MMKRCILIAAALLASGCDDPEAASKAAELLEFGVIAAKAVCPIESWSGCSAHDPLDLHVIRLADGACIVGTANTGKSISSLLLWGRAEPESDTCAFPDVGGGGSGLDIAGGIVSLHKIGCSDRTYDIETECAGFNLEAFD